jgi:YjbE family integral membrane protein
MTEFLYSPVFWVGLGQIILVNIVLSGDNAVVIALAARSLPPRQQRAAILWGSAAAIVLRIILTLVATEMLRLPWLKLAGSLLLFWIAVQLLMPEEDGDAIEGGAGTLFAAIRTILIADLVMSLDNVIGVAAAAKGDMLLLILGLAISIPLIVFGSTVILKLMNRFPVIITIGAALLGWVAGEMLVSDPILAEWITAHLSWLHIDLPLLGHISWAQILGATFVVVVGRLLAARVTRAGGRSVDLAAGDAQSESAMRQREHTRR